VNCNAGSVSAGVSGAFNSRGVGRSLAMPVCHAKRSLNACLTVILTSVKNDRGGDRPDDSAALWASGIACECPRALRQRYPGYYHLKRITPTPGSGPVKVI